MLELKNAKVVLNDEKNGIEIYFSEKPGEETRESLKFNGFRWSRYNKCWYSKNTEKAKTFIGKINNNPIESLENVDYENIDINDIANYSVPIEISKRENESVMFRNNYTDHTKVLRGRLQEANEKVIELCEKVGITPRIEYEAKRYLQNFKKKYSEAYIEYLRIKGENPSWLVTGRGGLNVRSYNKGQERIMKKTLLLNELSEKFDERIKRFEYRIKEVVEKKEKELIENIKEEDLTLEFKKVKVNINFEVNRIFKDFGRRLHLVQAHFNEKNQIYIIKNWGCWRGYDNEGNELFQTNTKGTLKEAKKICEHYVSKKNN